jgi:hypothetical protein
MKIATPQTARKKTVTDLFVTEKKIIAQKIFLLFQTPQPPVSPPRFRGAN